MEIDDYVFVINPADRFYGRKFVIVAIETDFARCITGYTVSGNSRSKTIWRDYASTDLQYCTRQQHTMSPQMQLL